MRVSLREQIIHTYIEKKVQIVSYEEHVAGLATCNTSLYVYIFIK
jgi:hypothetical protein